MRFDRIILPAVLTLTMAMPALALTHTRRGPTSAKPLHKRVTKSAKPVGPRAMDSERATQIQAALIKSGYLTGEG